MTVPAGAARVSYSISGTTYAVPFYFLRDEDLIVLLRAANGTETTAVLGVDYTVSGANNPAGGTVTFGAEPPGVSVVIIRDPDIEQPTDYPEGGRFPAASHERALDRLTMIAQRLDDKIGRALVIDDTDPNPPPSPTVIATVAGLESQIITLGALSSEITTLSGISADISTVSGVSGDVTTLAGISAQIAAVAANESNITAVAANETDISSVAANLGNIQDVKDALAASIASGISFDDTTAQLGETDVQGAIEAAKALVDAKSSIEIENGAFIKNNRSAAAFTKTGNNTAETSQQIWVEVNGVIRSIAGGTSITMPTLTAGTDYAIWVNPDGTLVADTSFSAPPTTGARQIGGFHYAPGGNAPAFDSGGNTTPQINEYSFWDLKFRPACPDPRGMTLVAGQFWCDIYLLGVNHHINGTSKFNSRIADGDDPPKIPDMFGGDGSATYSNANWWNMNEVLAAHGKQSLNYQEFAAAAYGVVEKTAGGTDPVDTILRENWTSMWGLMLAAGNMWVWGRDFGRGGNAASWSNNADGRGDTYTLSFVAMFSGHAIDHGHAGSRASYWRHPGSSSVIGARGRSDHIIQE